VVLGGTGHGIFISGGDFHTIGTNGDGTNDSIEGNYIGGMSQDGIRISSGGSITIAGNGIGVNINGADAGNAENGIGIDSDGTNDARYNTIGGNLSAEANTIAYNGDATGEHGVYIASATADFNTILGNAFYNNFDLGIELVAGANDDKAAPTITGQQPDGGDVSITGTSQYPSETIQIFDADSDDQEGQVYLGETTSPTVIMATTWWF